MLQHIVTRENVIVLNIETQGLQFTPLKFTSYIALKHNKTFVFVVLQFLFRPIRLPNVRLLRLRGKNRKRLRGGDYGCRLAKRTEHLHRTPQRSLYCTECHGCLGLIRTKLCNNDTGTIPTRAEKQSYKLIKSLTLICLFEGDVTWRFLMLFWILFCSVISV